MDAGLSTGQQYCSSHHYLEMRNKGALDEDDLHDVYGYRKQSPDIARIRQGAHPVRSLETYRLPSASHVD